jgi:hypothetical protein
MIMIFSLERLDQQIGSTGHVGSESQPALTLSNISPLYCMTPLHDTILENCEKHIRERPTLEGKCPEETAVFTLPSRHGQGHGRKARVDEIRSAAPQTADSYCIRKEVNCSHHQTT